MDSRESRSKCRIRNINLKAQANNCMNISSNKLVGKSSAYIQKYLISLRNSDLNYKRIFQLCAILIFSLAGFAIITPILPLIQAWGGVSTTQIGIYVASFALARLMANVPAGILADRYGGRYLLIVSLAIIMTGMIMSALAPTFVFLVISRIVTGIGSAFTAIAIQTELLLMANSSHRATVLSYSMIAHRIGVSIFPFLGGGLAVLFSWRAVFYFCALLNLIGIVIILMFFNQRQREPKLTIRNEADISEETLEHRQSGSPYILPSIYVLGFAIFIHRFGLERTLIPLFGDSIGLDSLKIGFTLSVSSIISIIAIFLGGRAADRYGRKLILQIGLIVLLVASSLFFLVNNYFLFLIANIIFGLASFTVALPIVIAADLSPSSHVGRSVSRVRLFDDAGMLVGPILLGWAMDLYSFPASIVISMTFLMLSLILATFVLKKQLFLPHTPI
jgi:MFS transporter, DHA1 family, multidrug resistance protein